MVGKSGPNQVFETLAQGRPLIISSFLANEKETTDWVITNRAGWLTRTPASLARLLEKLAAMLKEATLDDGVVDKKEFSHIVNFAVKRKSGKRILECLADGPRTEGITQ